MKALSKIAVGVVAAVGLGFAAAAFSHGPGMGYGGYGMGYGPGGGYGMDGPYGFGGYSEATLNEQLTNVKNELKITEAQTQAWNAFETAVRNQAKSVADMRATMYASRSNPQAHYAIMQQRYAGIQAVQKARTDLDKVLTDEQKAAFVGSYGYCN